MRRIIITVLIVWFMLLGGTAMADTIYTWTDADGVKRYSNHQPPEGVDNVETIEEVRQKGSAPDSVTKRFAAGDDEPEAPRDPGTPGSRPPETGLPPW